jgi:hypothetical protein
MTVADLKAGQLFQYFKPSANRWSNKHYVAEIISFEEIRSCLVVTLAGRQIFLDKTYEIKIY